MEMNSFFKVALGAAIAAFAFAACDSGSSSDSGSAESSPAAADGSTTAGAWPYMNPAVSYGKITDSRDGQVYKTVVIGSQTWMAQNLNYAVLNSWCYENSADSCSKYGRLYRWSAAMAVDAMYDSLSLGADGIKHQGLCPDGWHIPNDNEWDTLAVAVGGVANKNGYDDAGEKLKNMTGWELRNGTDDYGFSALAAGDFNTRYFDYSGNFAVFWSASEFKAGDAYEWMLADQDYALDRYDNGKEEGLSVRCVKN